MKSEVKREEEERETPEPSAAWHSVPLPSNVQNTLKEQIEAAFLQVTPSAP